MNDGPNISNTEWALYISALLLVDIVQAFLEWVAIGFFVNPFIDIFTGMSKAFYMQTRGLNLSDSRRIMGLLGTFFLELIPLVDELPLWCLDGVYDMILYKNDEKIRKLKEAEEAKESAKIEARGGGQKAA